MKRKFMSLDEVFSGEYNNYKGVLKALDSYAEQYSRIDNIPLRRKHNRSAFSLLREVFGDGKNCDEERVRSCYRYYLDKREELMYRKDYKGDVILSSSLLEQN